MNDDDDDDDGSDMTVFQRPETAVSLIGLYNGNSLIERIILVFFNSFN